jgi:hypothetical protein
MSMICLCLLSCSSAQNQSIKIPNDERQRLPIEHLNFIGSNFIKAYMSKDVNQRRLAEMYLIGVLDSTEGKTWCGYDIALPGSIQEQIYLGFKKAPKNSLNRRASEIIKSILSNKLPCKDNTQ